MEEGTFGSGPYVEVSIGLFTQGGIFMAFSIVHGDIVQMGTDAIVNAANSGLLAGSGVCGAIFHAGPGNSRKPAWPRRPARRGSQY